MVPENGCGVGGLLSLSDEVLLAWLSVCLIH